MEATPRINASFLQQFENQTVIIVGKCIQVRGENALVEAGGNINVHLSPNGTCVPGNFVEIVGKVQPDMTVKSLLTTDWGTDVDMAAVDAVVDLTHRYKDLFY
ncbi:replication factor A protein 3 [Ascobolus immersus RN42]|uniref:Replication factor A protein 3 n=1 Tax=Ascobolus immersus RN42 TaxID=1160509 RepID=A0A3N4I1B7_ASCIM|nr:replication factor A protein 3 [Ascobolus immersus RN42]